MSDHKEKAISLLAGVISRDKAKEIVEAIIEAVKEEMPGPAQLPEDWTNYPGFGNGGNYGHLD